MTTKRTPRFVLHNGLSEINDKSQIQQISTVLRLRTKDKIIGIHDEKQYLLEIYSIEKNSIKLNPVEEIIPEHSPENDFYLKLLIPFLKNDKTELVLQKCTELGANEFQFVDFDHSVKSQGNWQNKLERWQKIIIEAVEQSERLKIPTINPETIKVEDIKLENNEIGTVFLERLYKKKENMAPPAKSKTVGVRGVLIFGPEGGFSEKEKKLLIEKGFQPKSLGNRILRAETAIIVGCFTETN